ncbi:unnamed protein product [Pleuronectes platessa]|uniref:Uncharacterized protein n=1 Tax=Pleuronectes platessa TaxID=8262 RepID=A0A9N7Z577_PLEPL|nr:unnamed protein product [Pleuronectes platessa]
MHSARGAGFGGVRCLAQGHLDSGIGRVLFGLWNKSGCCPGRKLNTEVVDAGDGGIETERSTDMKNRVVGLDSRLRQRVEQSMVSNQQDHDPPSRPERHSSPQSPSTATHHEPLPRSWSNARTQCQRNTGSATTTTISPHNTESATLGPPPRPPVRDQQTAIHGSARRPWICG